MRLLHLGCDGDIREGFDNLDPSINGWKFEFGLPYDDSSVDGITISHALMYVRETAWLPVFREFYRALKPGGIVRITEDDVESPESARFKRPYPGAACITGPFMTARFLREAGFEPFRCDAERTFFKNKSLLIAHRERVPSYVFYMEGMRPGPGISAHK